ncbi:hypothetical protein [Vibrio coralliirubri]|uniref:hypothetical protein n=1 Tax=Vibrio coralliirubri TaxID=1516159 RepID=UPI000637253E|nr:hypothetical protein [Vibrio coralliirubri]CDT07716.1 hypothetical protein VCR1J2_200024 [Vibrio coralliirubri]CDT78364.1 hypothetical protein VCR8J2_190720 [Vibrio coralliirubri]
MEHLVSQILALLTFFLFPVLQFFLLKKASQDIALPQLWYLPQYGYRLVIRNAHSNKNLYDVKYKAYLKIRVKPEVNYDHGVVPPVPSVCATIYDELESSEMTLLLAREDKAMLCFKLLGESKSNLEFCKTDYFGNVEKKIKIEPNVEIHVEYTAIIDNPFNFDTRILKRVILDFDQFMNCHELINDCIPEEQMVENLRVITVGK